VIQPATAELNRTPASMGWPSFASASAGPSLADQMLTGSVGGGNSDAVTVIPAPGVSRLPLSSTARDRTS
jgi:hypothetical protein